MELVGFDDLQARSAYQPVIHRQGDRWIAYIGHHGGTALNPLTGQQESNGTSIVDVTNPKQPKYLAHIPGESGQGEAGGAQMVRVCDGSQLPRADKSKVYLLRTFGNTGHEIWDVTDPAKPTRLTVVVSGLRATHKNWWECDTGIAYLVSGAPGWRTDRMTQIYDLSDPAKPVFIRDFGLPGQQPGGDRPAADRPARRHLHGPNGNRVYFGYGTAAGGVVQIVDREKLLNGPKEPTNQNLLYPQIGRLDLPPNVGAHTVFPVLRHGDSRVRPAHRVGRARLRRHHQRIDRQRVPRGAADGVDRRHHRPSRSRSACRTGPSPKRAATSAAAAGASARTPRTRTSRSIYYKRVMFFAHFNAGVRAVDIRDPFHPKEIGFYIPAITDKTDKRCVDTGANERCKVAIQTNNVEVDDRGYIYIVDRANTGMHILELTGAARKVANLP